MHLGLLDHRDNKVHWDSRAQEVTLVTLALVAHKDHLEGQDQQVLRVLRDLKDHVDLWDLQDHKATLDLLVLQARQVT